MKNHNYNKILEAVNRGILLALDDFEDEEQVLNIKSKQVLNRDYTKEYLDLMKEVVDLGLPSGTLWCKYNLGVNPKHLEKAEDWYGDYYAWGELEPNKSCFINDTYKFGYIKTNSIKADIDIKYNDNDNLTLLLPEDDAAYLNMHIGNYKFHIPTKELFIELLHYTTLDSIYMYNKTDGYNNVPGLNGIVLKSKINGNELFIPYTYIKKALNSTLHLNGPYIWSSTVYKWDHNNAWHLDFGGGKEGMTTLARYCGMPIRPVVNL